MHAHTYNTLLTCAGVPIISTVAGNNSLGTERIFFNGYQGRALSVALNKPQVSIGLFLQWVSISECRVRALS